MFIHIDKMFCTSSLWYIVYACSMSPWQHFHYTRERSVQVRYDIWYCLVFCTGTLCRRVFCQLYWGCRKAGCLGCIARFRGNKVDVKQPLLQFDIDMLQVIPYFLHFRSVVNACYKISRVVDLEFGEKVFSNVILDNEYESMVLKVGMVTAKFVLWWCIKL